MGNYHWFSGEGMVDGVELREGAAYRNRWIRSPAVSYISDRAPR